MAAADLPPSQPGQAPSGARAVARPQVDKHTFFPVATHKFVALSICSFGLYELYWCYKNWQRIKGPRDDLSPFWRAFFAQLWAYSLFDEIRSIAERRRLAVGWNSSFLAILFFLLLAAWRLPNPWGLLGLLSFAPMLPVVMTVQRIHSAEDATEGPNDNYSAANIATLIIGFLLVLLAVLGMVDPTLSEP